MPGRVGLLHELMYRAVPADAIMRRYLRSLVAKPIGGAGQCAFHDMDDDGLRPVGVASGREVGAWGLYDLHNIPFLASSWWWVEGSMYGCLVCKIVKILVWDGVGLWIGGLYGNCWGWIGCSYSFWYCWGVFYIRRWDLKENIRLFVRFVEVGKDCGGYIQVRCHFQETIKLN